MAQGRVDGPGFCSKIFNWDQGQAMAEPMYFTVPAMFKISYLIVFFVSTSNTGLTVSA